MRYELCQHKDSSYGIRIKYGGEPMHSGMHPLEQAKILYVNQTHAREIFKEPTCVWDVGMGAGVNASAIIKEAVKQNANVEVISFEFDLDAITLSLEHKEKFPHLIDLPAEDLLKKGEVQIDKVSWKLLKGDFKEEHLKAPKTNMLLWDPFSVKTEEDMWSYHLLNSVTECVAERGCVFSTYSASTRLRASLLSLNWRVGYGSALSHRTESTVAGFGEFKDLIQAPLGEKFKNKFLNSHARLPSDVEGDEEIERRVLSVL